VVNEGSVVVVLGGAGARLALVFAGGGVVDSIDGQRNAGGAGLPSATGATVARNDKSADDGARGRDFCRAGCLRRRREGLDGGEGAVHDDDEGPAVSVDGTCLVLAIMFAGAKQVLHLKVRQPSLCPPAGQDAVACRLFLDDEQNVKNDEENVGNSDEKRRKDVV
jgi:hypothetical protein